MPAVSKAQNAASEIQKAYLAGILDADGCVGACELSDKRHRRGPGVFFVVHITMVDREPAELAYALYGGNFRLCPQRGLGYKRLYRWQITGEDGAVFLRAIRPYLLVKGAQADAYIEARQTFTGGPRKGFKGSVQPTAADIALRFSCLRRIQSLNQREHHACS